MRHLTLLFTTCLFIAQLNISNSNAAEPNNLDIYLLMGQSNMAGRGKMTDEDKLPVDGILMLDKNNTWQSAKHPLHFDKSIAAVGLGLDFAKNVTKKEGTVIGLVPCAVGGTKLSRWVKEADLYENAVKRAKLAAKSGTIRGVLWHQGEGDTGNAELANTYAPRLDAMIADLRKDLDQPELPFVAGQLGQFFLKKRSTPESATVANALKKLPSRVENTGHVLSTGIDHKGDQTHFNAQGYKEFGKRYAQVMNKLLQQ
ncbi:MAG: sialate O-acetylesterase [Blastopirellula sp.]|nr:MAG: sialate O-acetylesterase [Blastopirellula sp.]